MQNIANQVMREISTFNGIELVNESKAKFGKMGLKEGVRGGMCGLRWLQDIGQ